MDHIELNEQVYFFPYKLVEVVFILLLSLNTLSISILNLHILAVQC